MSNVIIKKLENPEGIDLSRYNGTIQWYKLPTWLKFVFLRINGYDKGNITKDTMFEVNFDGAKSVGIKVGIYFYSQALTIEDAEREAKTCIEMLDNEDLDLPVMYDVEYPAQTKLGKEKFTEIILHFCKLINDAGYAAGVYSNKYWFRDYMDHKQLVENDIPLWCAQYYKELTFEYPEDITIWQYSSTGSINGINGDVDLNTILKGSLDSLILLNNRYRANVSRWIKENKGTRWWYKHPNGRYTKNDFEFINNKWYYFDEEGWMVEGWRLIKGKWYYFRPYDGYMVTNEWVKGQDALWYYVDENGEMVTDTLKVINGAKYSFGRDGHMEITNNDGALI